MNTYLDKTAIADICSGGHITYLGLFGSVARGEQNSSSDVDLLIDFAHPKSFFELGKIQEKFEKLLQKPVDLILRTNIKEGLKKYILKDVITLYEEK